MTEIIREIDEELKAKRYKELAQKYGKYVIGVILLIGLSFGGYAFLQDRNENLRNQRATIFGNLVRDNATSAEAWVGFATARNDEFSHLAWRFAAGDYMQQGKTDEAQKIMQELTVNDSFHGDFAKAMNQILQLNIGQQVEPLSVNNSSFEAFAILAEAERLIKTGNKKEAIEILENKLLQAVDINENPALQSLFFGLVEALKSEF